MVAILTVFAADRYIPFVGTAEPDGINEVAVELPVVKKFVPSNVRADPVAKALVLDAYTNPLAVNDVRLVPPLATGSADVNDRLENEAAVEEATRVEVPHVTLDGI